jgi:hypothetical protein
VPTNSLTPKTLQILGHASKSLCKPFAHKVRDIALARAGQFGVSLCFFPIALCLLCPAFHFNNPPVIPIELLIQTWGVLMKGMGRRLDWIGPEERQPNIGRRRSCGHGLDRLELDRGRLLPAGSGHMCAAPINQAAAKCRLCL